MTKAEVAAAIAQKTGMDKTQAVAAVEAFMETVKESIASSDPVYLRGFGSFIIKHRAQKAARNITKQTTVVVPAHDIPAFKPCDSFLEMLNK